jgi:phospholipid/cholesterol/gamma-HCH transport system substrate-binding protein
MRALRAIALAGVLALTVVTTATTAGCAGGGLQGVSLPGGADLGDDPYPLTIEFADVLELVPQSLVKVNDVTVGTVTGIRISSEYTALVDVTINGDVAIPADATARVAQTSLLGEKYVAIEPNRGAGAAPARIPDGAMIPLARTDTAAEVEQVLGALSMLLNGGGVAQIRTIAVEFNAALDGNEDEVRALMRDLDVLVGGLDERRSEITRALDELNRLSSVLRERRGRIDTALDDIAPGLRELERQRGDLVDLLRSLDRLSDVAVDVIHRSQDDVVDDLELLRPVLRKLADSGDDLPKSLELIGTIPFTNDALEGFAGDYANLYVRVDADLGPLLATLLSSAPPVGLPLAPAGAPGPPGAASELLAPLQGAPLPSGSELPMVGTPVPSMPQDPAGALDQVGGGS